MSNNNNFQRPPREKNALDNPKLNLNAPCPTAQGQTSALCFGLYDNHPRLTVYTRDPSEKGVKEKGFGKIEARLDTPTMFVIINQLRMLAQESLEGKREKVKYKLECKQHNWAGGKKSDQLITKSEFFLGRDEDGTIWMSVQDNYNQRPRIKFEIGSTEYNHWYGMDGNPMDKGTASAHYANGYANLLSEYYGNMQVSMYVPPEPKDNNGYGGGQRNNGGGGGGQQQRGYNNNSNNSGGGYEEDIPF